MLMVRRLGNRTQLKLLGHVEDLRSLREGGSVPDGDRIVDGLAFVDKLWTWAKSGVGGLVSLEVDWDRAGLDYLNNEKGNPSRGGPTADQDEAHTHTHKTRTRTAMTTDADSRGYGNTKANQRTPGRGKEGKKKDDTKKED